MTSEYFMFNGIKSIDMGLYLVRLDSGFYGTPIGGGKSLITEKIPYRDNITYFRTELEPMEFSITVSPLEGLWTEDFKNKIFKWINTRTPQEFRTADFIGKLCHCVCTNPIELFTGGYEQGYITLDFQATTPYWLTDIEISTYDCSSASSLSPITIEIYNKSNVQNAYGEYYYYPKINIDLLNDETSIFIYNESDGNRLFKFENLEENECLFIDNDLKYIKADSGAYVLSKFNKNWFRMPYGKSILKIHNKCNIQFTCQYPIYI